MLLTHMGVSNQRRGCFTSIDWTASHSTYRWQHSRPSVSSVVSVFWFFSDSNTEITEGIYDTRTDVKFFF